eukprot:8039991-Alexandrium_andersonii.AAC.1
MACLGASAILKKLLAEGAPDEALCEAGAELAKSLRRTGCWNNKLPDFMKQLVQKFADANACLPGEGSAPAVAGKGSVKAAKAPSKAKVGAEARQPKPE